MYIGINIVQMLLYMCFCSESAKTRGRKDPRQTETTCHRKLSRIGIGRMPVGHRREPVDGDGISVLLRKLRSGGHSYMCMSPRAKRYVSMFTCNMIYYTTNCLISDVLITGSLYFHFFTSFATLKATVQILS